MIPALANLQPEPVWKHFDRLAAIPRASTKEAAARDYVRGLAAKLGLESVQDDVGQSRDPETCAAGTRGSADGSLTGPPRHGV